jgi:O-antigen/teichoic acid export membrane protein
VAFALVLVWGYPILGAVVYWNALPVVAFLLAAYYLNKDIGLQSVPTQLPEPGRLRRLFSFSWPLAIGASLFLLLNQIDLLMIGYFLDSSQVGYYRSVVPLR